MLQSFHSTKLFDGYTACFRQWKATDTHCKYLHGYAISLKLTFNGKLDERNWVYDFGGFKRAKNKIDGKSPKDWLDWLLDHTTIIAEDDPYLHHFEALDELGIIQLRVLPFTGMERFAEHVHNKLNAFIDAETGGRVSIIKTEVFEHSRNSASYGMGVGNEL